MKGNEPSFWIGVGTTVGCIALFLVAMWAGAPPQIGAGIAFAVLFLVGLSAPQMGLSIGQFFLGVGTVVAVAFLVFTICAMVVFSTFF